MAVRYQVIISNHNGQQVAVLDTWRSLNINRKINGIEDCMLGVDYDDATAISTTFQTDYFIEVRRADLARSVPWQTEFLGFHRSTQREITERGNRILTSYSRSLEDLLHRRVIAYKSGSAQTDKNGPADDVMKALVRENLLTTGTRLVTGLTPNIIVIADSSQAPTWRGAGLAYRNLLDVLQDISAASLVDFKVVRSVIGPPEFMFLTYYPQFGTNRAVGSTQPVIFSTGFGNVSNAGYTLSRTDEANIIIVTGSGEGDLRNVVIVESAAIIDSPWNRIEYSRDARNTATNEGLTIQGNEVLNELKAHESFVFEALQDSQFLYGRDYFLGDTCTVRFDEVQTNKRLVQLSLSMSEGRETINCEFADLIPSPQNLPDIINNITKHIAHLEHSGNV